MTRSAAANPMPAAPSTDPSALRVVLFGMPDAGKSSLLGALAQAAEAQERQLQGRLFDTTTGLAELQRRVYDEKPRETLQEIVPYPVRYEPFKGQKPDPNARIHAILYDCDGRVANEILTQSKSIDDPRAGMLAEAVRRADALVLVVDASATDEQVDADFAEFMRFLRLLEQHRTQRTEVGGLPVFLVLSKCDLLAKPGQSAGAWNERIEERRAQLTSRFRDFLARDSAGFGTLALNVATTAVRQPPFRGPGAEREPYQVADLFRRALLAARDYRQRTWRSRRQLTILVGSAALFLALLIGAAVTLALTREAMQPVALAGIVENYRARENPAPSARLTEPLQRKISELTDIQRHPDFKRLSDEQREYVESRLSELVAYQEYKSRLERERPPDQLRIPEELNQAETRWRDALVPPAEYRDVWSQTEAELLRQKWLDDVSAMRRAIAEVIERWHGFTQDGNDLLQFRADGGGVLPWSEWHDRLRDLLARASRPAYAENDPLRGSRAMPALRAPAVTYGSVYEFRTVEDARRDWESIRNRLHRLRDLSLALGLAGDGSAEIAPLKLPDGFAADQARTRLEQLRKVYPNFEDWRYDELPAVAAADVRVAAQRSFTRLIDAGRDVVLREARQVFSGRETREGWLVIARWLPQAPALRELGQLAKVLQRLSGDGVADPAVVLSEFLLKPSFPVRFRTIRVTIPDDVHASRLRPVSALTVHHTGPNGPVTLRFTRQGEEVRDIRGRRSTFTFVQEGDQTLTFTPGETFYADLTVRDDSQPVREYKLTWLQARSNMYRFESLRLLPRFYPVSEADPLRGVVKDVSLAFEPDSGVPVVPALMPIVILN